MQWQEIRDRYPQQWLVVEALEAHTEGERRILEELAVLETCPDSASAMKLYLRFHRDQPARELYVLHTNRKKLDVTERRWLGIRREVEAVTPPRTASRARQITAQCQDGYSENPGLGEEWEGWDEEGRSVP